MWLSFCTAGSESSDRQLVERKMQSSIKGMYINNKVIVCVYRKEKMHYK